MSVLINVSFKIYEESSYNFELDLLIISYWSCIWYMGEPGV